jgi:predicted Fe-Mo cluster-binding NifX family protein
MKIAAITEDGKTISRHFGRAPYYLVVTIHDQEIVDRELRSKPSHAQFHAGEPMHRRTEAQHGSGPAAEQRHGRMAETITDCEAVLSGGMGMGAYEGMKAHNIRPVVTDIVDIEEAVRAFVSGQIVDHIERLH